MEEKLVKIGGLLSSCFISELLQDPFVTDISYNGNEIYYLHNKKAKALNSRFFYPATFIFRHVS